MRCTIILDSYKLNLHISSSENIQLNFTEKGNNVFLMLYIYYNFDFMEWNPIVSPMSTYQNGCVTSLHTTWPSHASVKSSHTQKSKSMEPMLFTLPFGITVGTYRASGIEIKFGGKIANRGTGAKQW